MHEHTRRDVLRTAVMTGVWLTSRGLRAAGMSPNEKLNLAFIGVGGRGEANLDAFQGENIVALCDMDEQHAARVYERYPRVPKFHDFRRMLGNVAYRTGEKLTWDARNLRAVNCPKADGLLRREYRAGWTLEANRG